MGKIMFRPLSTRYEARDWIFERRHIGQGTKKTRHLKRGISGRLRSYKLRGFRHVLTSLSYSL